ncbi:MAG: lasso peptide biosynthesis B2 protein [Gammaproteobacteria bacterium]|nr:lasso peptide biosynthesis B2 protein [Gammaproteobacteria bacterium]MBU1629121.1 lasso peptide biosynthesis B2 protein [Gammaproteobacteria bacterium]MBU1926873.1 lasso peptide biosynthesis B2 protein [Gammaproteobacteria bacterium]MBU2546130.1 lasso peptide biosynthesis B2 protein [Gammaproteobacteria bacterium]
MFFEIPDHIYLTDFNDEIIVLDLLKDRYLILPKDLSDVLALALKMPFRKINHQYFLMPHTKHFIAADDLDATLHSLQDQNILLGLDAFSPSNKIIEHKMLLTGGPTLDWRIDVEKLKTPVSLKLFFKAYFCLIQVCWTLKRKGFYALIQKIKTAEKRKSNHNRTPNFEPLIKAMHKACYFYPAHTACLEWASALTLLALKQNIPCRLQIGVQNLPFAAHAWVEYEGKIIADQPNLSEQLSVILSEPLEDMK